MALVILGVLVAVLVVLFVSPGGPPKLDPRRHPHSVAVLEQVPVNDTLQWVLIRSEKSFAAGRDDKMTRAQFVEDVLSLSSYLAKRFHQDKILLGRHDFEVSSPLSAKYFETLRASRKQLIWFERSAHMPNTGGAVGV